MQKKEEPFFLNGLVQGWIRQRTDSEGAGTTCLVLWLSQSTSDHWEEGGGHPARGSPIRSTPQSLVPAPSTLTQCSAVAQAQQCSTGTGNYRGWVTAPTPARARWQQIRRWHPEGLCVCESRAPSTPPRWLTRPPLLGAGSQPITGQIGAAGLTRQEKHTPSSYRCHYPILIRPREGIQQS